MKDIKGENKMFRNGLTIPSKSMIKHWFLFTFFVVVIGFFAFVSLVGYPINYLYKTLIKGD